MKGEEATATKREREREREEGVNIFCGVVWACVDSEFYSGFERAFPQA